jgi:hypothetical protein
VTAQGLSSDPPDDYAVCPDCGMVVFATALRGRHTHGTHHAANVVATRRVRDGWLPCVGPLADAAREEGVEVEKEGTWGDLDLEGHVVFREMQWIRDAQAEDLAAFAVYPEFIARLVARLREAAAYCRAGLPWWRARLAEDAVPETRVWALETGRNEPAGAIRGKPW